MGRFVFAAFGLALLAPQLTAAQAAGRQARHAELATPGASRGVDYYPGWGRERVKIYGVYPGLVYGGATSPPAGR